MTQISIPYMQLRGGSSKGLYFLSEDLPKSPEERNRILLAAMGGDDPRQIDGLGGADPLTSKVAVVSLSSRPDADIDYLFIQVVLGTDRVDTTPNCGNILAGVLPFAIEAGLVPTISPTTSARVHMINSGKVCEVVVCTPDGQLSYEGMTRIDGVPGTAAPVICNYLDTAGSACGELLPTGNLLDTVCGIEVTCIDNGMPVIVMRASDLGISGYEPSEELNGNDTLKQKLEQIRLEIGPAMNLGNVEQKAVPKMSLISKARHGGHVNTRTFIPHQCHATIGVLGAVSVATACIIPGTVAAGIATVPEGSVKKMSVEHPQGEFSITLNVDQSSSLPVVKNAGLLRTARLLSKGDLFVNV